MKKFQLYWLMVFMMFVTTDIFGDNVINISRRDGLSNSSIQSICQDEDGFIWLATIDGLNRWNGERMDIFPTAWDEKPDLSGNMIEKIYPSSDGKFWICTNHGLDLFDPKTLDVRSYPQKLNYMKLAVGDSKHIVSLTTENELYYLNENGDFCLMELNKALEYDKIKNLYLETNSTLVIFHETDGIIIYKIIDDTTISSGKTLMYNNSISLKNPIQNAFIDGSRAFILDSSSALYSFDFESKELVYLKSIAQDIPSVEVTSIIWDGKDIVMSIKMSGVIRLVDNPSLPEKYTVERYPIQCDVFTMIKDKRQDIIWVGTDGYGLMQLNRSAYTFNSFNFDRQSKKISSSIRAIFMDKEGSLWLGLKGDGIRRIRKFRSDIPIQENDIETIDVKSGLISNNYVYAFSNSSRELIWIGTDSNILHYYSYSDHKIHSIVLDEAIQYIHSILEISPETLYIATVGNGVFKLTLSLDDKPRLISTEKLGNTTGPQSSELFFAMYKYNDSIIWLGNRGKGAISYNINSGVSDTLSLSHLGKVSYDDVFAVSSDDLGNVWFGTGSGIIKQTGDSLSVLDINTGAVHALVNDKKGNMWISTNNGLYRYDVANDYVEYYGYAQGLEINSFSDGAFLLSSSSNLYFGGIDGFVIVSHSDYPNLSQNGQFYPKIVFENVQINNAKYLISSLLDDGVLTIDAKQSITSLSFITLDYLNNNYTYYYRVAGYSDIWKKCGREINFADMDYGQYNVEIKYVNAYGYESEPYILPIRVKAPFYASVLAKILYFLFILFVIVYLVVSVYKKRIAKRKAKQELWETELKECQKKSISNILSDISHEISMPLTVITGTCQMMLDINKNTELQEYANMIQQNATRLQNLSGILQHLCSNSEKINIELVDVTKQSETIFNSFRSEIIGREAAFNISIPPSIIWPIDIANYSILLNLLMNTILSHIKQHSDVNIIIQKDEKQLDLSIVCQQLDIPYMAILKQLEEDTALEDYHDSKSSNGGLALEVCRIIIKQLHGGILLDVEHNKLTITLPFILPTTIDDKNDALEVLHMDIHPETSIMAKNRPVNNTVFNPSRKSILILNYGNEIMTFVTDALAKDYNIISLSTCDGVYSELKKELPSIILCDTTYLAEISGMIKDIKQAKETVCIPIILFVLSSKIKTLPDILNNQIDLLVTIPFDVNYLRASVAQLTNRNNVLKDYFHSSLSSFELKDGKYIHDEDIDFINKMCAIIDDNITNPSLTTEFIAKEMCISIRNLYRRLDGIAKAPSNIIKEYRLSAAEKLLSTTKLTIDEIIYKTGFQNRGTFFRLFSAKYNMTPKAYRKMTMENAFSEQDNHH